MIVFNLVCEHGHRFEGWFSAADDFDRQLERGLVECPMCASKAISKLPSAPRLNLSSGSEPRDAAKSEPTPEQATALWLKMARHIIANTEDVGDRFADEARRIHYSEAPQRSIRGVASRDQAVELADEGIEVFSFPLPKGLKEPVQ